MWSMSQRLGVSLLQNIQIVKSVAVPVTNTLFSSSRWFSGLSRAPALTSPPVGISNTAHQLLQPAASPLVQLVNGFKIKGRLKRRCKDCYFVVRQERMYVMCKSHGRHKQMSMKKKEKNTWILTDATQSKVRPW